MNRKIFCNFFKKYEEGLTYIPYPGLLGHKIYNEISKLAWNKWILQQTIIINEKKMNMLNKNDQKKIENYMIKFLFKNKQQL
nr:oxidative damage protection protein [Buchnera aphidicola]